MKLAGNFKKTKGKNNEKIVKAEQSAVREISNKVKTKKGVKIIGENYVVT